MGAIDCNFFPRYFYPFHLFFLVLFGSILLPNSQDDIHAKDERIEELEEALRESVRITADREIAVAEGEMKLKKAEERV